MRDHVLVLIDEDAKTIRFRQSWVDEAIRCAERGREKIVRPELDPEGDAACAGTAAHAAIEAHLGGHLPIELMEQYAVEWARKMIDEGVTRKDGNVYPIEFKSFDGPTELLYHAGNCTRGWIQDILPVLHERDEFDGDQEVDFDFVAYEYRGWTIAFQGTIDHVPHRGRRVWDWKNKGRDMKLYELQKYDVQKVVYTAAAVNGAFDRPFDWPIEFAWGNNVRLKTKARGQIVVAEVHQGHWDWLQERTRRFVDLYLDIGLDRKWPTDEDHFLCSKAWCPYYADCRGKFITADMDAFGR